jgi:hypothetical protein
MQPSPKEVLTRWFVALWRERDPAVIATMRDARSRSSGLAPHDIDGVDAFRAFYDRARSILSDTDVRFEQIIEQAELVAADVAITGHVGDKPVEIRFSVFGRVVDGVLIQGHNVIDVAGFMKQLGHAGPATLADAFGMIEARSPINDGGGPHTPAQR